MPLPHLLQLCPQMPTLERALAERFTVHRLFDDAALDAVVGADASRIRAVVTGGHVGIPTALARRLPALEIVAVNGVGVDKVDLDEARRRGYRVSNTPEVLTDDVADLAIGLIIALLRRIPQGDAFIRRGCWAAGDIELASKVTRRRFGIYGYGRIGAAIARRLAGFDSPIAYSDKVHRDVPYPYFATPRELAAACDVLIVAVGANAETRNAIDAEVLAALGPTGVLVNVGRGSVVDEAAVVEALRAGSMAGAALDVFADEPNVPSGLLDCPNVVLTPHIGTATRETRQDMADLILANLDAHFAGRPLPTAVA